MLFKYLTWRSRDRRHSSASFFISATAFGYDGFLSMVIVRGFTVCGWASALRKKRFASAVSRQAESRKSIVWPHLSTAR
jgi:hypothetical protein